MVAFQTVDDGRPARLYLLRFNAEHSERYWLQSFEATHQSHLVLLLDLRDKHAYEMAMRLGGPDRVKALLRHCDQTQTIPTLHAAVPMSLAMPVLETLAPSFVPGVVQCPDDSFAIWCVAAGGSCIAHRKRPTVASPDSPGASQGGETCL